jgi:hypothetical protein
VGKRRKKVEQAVQKEREPERCISMAHHEELRIEDNAVPLEQLGGPVERRIIRGRYGGL